jgi:tRNA nucleotidyltransferase (CCA-adding enzyme)
VTREEHALARTERKSGRGYRGFVFVAAPDVTLLQDLARRDLTINAMARADDGTLIDPFGGAADLAAGVLRHVSPAFAEDPLRVLRVARFAARFGFAVVPETMALMRMLVEEGELAELSPERVWQELARGLMEPRPSRMLAVLRDCGALAEVLPEVDALYGRAETGAARTGAGAHVEQALDCAAARGVALAARYAVLAMDLGLGAAAPPALNARGGDGPAPRGHAARSARLADRVSARLRAPVDCRDAARLAARWHGVVARAPELRPAMLLDLVGAADALRRPERLDVLLAACEADALSGDCRADARYAPAAIVRDALAVVRAVRVAAVAREAQRRRQAGGDAVGAAIRAARLSALRGWRRRAQIR